MTADDSRLRALVALAKKMPHTESARRDASSYVAFEQRLEQHGHSRSTVRRLRRPALAGSVVVVATLALSLLAPFRDVYRGAVLTYVVDAAAPDPLGSGAASAGRSLHFSDGSRVTLEESATAEVAELTDRGARVVLARGSAEVSIAKRKNAAWRFQAGPYSVRVTGTAFKLAWSSDAQTFEINMRHGSVIVTGPLAAQGVALQKGQRLVASGRDHRLVVEDVARASLSKVTSSAAGERTKADRAERAASRSGARAKVLGREAAGRVEHDWAKKVAQGAFAEVLREAKAIGYPRVLEAAQVSDLSALADAARYGRQNALGRNALLALRERFPDSEMAKDSAFFLGRLSTDASALRWYDRYLTEQPDGVYVSQAVGRSMMLRYERNDLEAAARLAATYLARFPGGPYAASARKLSDPARVSQPTP